MMPLGLRLCEMHGVVSSWPCRWGGGVEAGDNIVRKHGEDCYSVCTVAWLRMKSCTYLFIVLEKTPYFLLYELFVIYH